MTQTISSLGWTPVGTLIGTMSAPITLNFATDQNWFVGFNSGFQGDPVEAVSLKVDNSGNNTPIFYQRGSGQETIPAYSIGYIDIRTLFGLTFTCANPVSVNMEVQNFPAQYGFSPASANPNILTNDPYFSSVIGLYHFDGLTGGTINYLDSSKNGFGVLNNTAGGMDLQTNVKKFGSATLSVPSGANNATSANSLLISNNFTLEFWFYISSITVTATYTFMNIGNSLTLNYTPFTKRLDLIWGNGGSTMSVFLTNYISGFGVGQWVNLAWSFINQTGYFFVNGNNAIVQQMSVPTLAAGNFVITAATIGPNGVLVDELRMTNAARYTGNFMVQTAPFLNQ